MGEHNGLIAMPDSIFGRYHNACTDPCDMIEGPCACGAWHHLYEWDEEVRAIVLAENPWASSLLSNLAGVKSVYGEDSIGRRHLRPVKVED